MVASKMTDCGVMLWQAQLLLLIGTMFEQLGQQQENWDILRSLLSILNEVRSPRVNDHSTC
jgi:hypothetical protein